MSADDDETTLVIGTWSFAGKGWPTQGDAALAIAATNRAREYAKWRAEQRNSPRSGKEQGQ